MNNSAFGKTQENLKKRVQLLVFNGLPNQVTAVQSNVATLTLNRPIYVGFSVLELSKLHMYDFHHNHMREKYLRPVQLRLLITNTDSLAYADQTDNIYTNIAEDAANRYDFCKYPFVQTGKGCQT